MSKGSKQRPTDHDAFASNFDRIFSGKPTRGSFVQDPKTGKLVPKDEFVDSSDTSAPYVIGDIQPYQSMQTGEMITSRSHHKEHLRRHGLIEIGNEIKAAMTKQKPRDDREARRRAIAEVLNAKGY